jgi:hypothetical protein
MSFVRLAPMVAFAASWAFTPVRALAEEPPAPSVSVVAATPLPAPAFQPTPARLQVPRLAGNQIRLDGVLDEPVWTDAAVVSGLARAEPVEDGRAGFGSSEFRIFYDADAIYVGARVHQPRGVRRANVTPRDLLGNDDSVNIYLKPVQDSDIAYLFRINPLGIQRDVMFGYSNLVDTWDGVWDSASQLLPDGYAVEVRLPFRIFRFTREPVQNWGISLGVRTGSLGELALWPAYSSDRGNQLDQLGALEGMTQIHAGHDLDLMPSLVTRLAGSAEKGGDFVWDDRGVLHLRQPGTVDPGLDVRYGLTPGITASLTLNPDFSQIEADADQLEYNLRYPILLKEKRPFFLEGQNNFETPVPLVYSRGINDPVMGVKLAGTEGAFTVGVLSAWDQDSPRSRISFDPTVAHPRLTGFEDTAGKDVVTTIGRAQYTIGQGSRVGIFFADKVAVARADDERKAQQDLVAADLRLNPAKIYVLTTHLGLSRSAVLDGGDDAFTGVFYYVNARREARRLFIEAETAYYGESFRAETSDLARVGHAPSLLRLAYKLETGHSAVAYVRPEVTGNLVDRVSDFSRSDWSIVPAISAQLAGNTTVALAYHQGEEFYDGHEFAYRLVTAAVTSSPLSWLDVQASGGAGDRVNYNPEDVFLGTAYEGSLGITLRPSPLTELDLSYVKSQLYRPSTDAPAQDVDIGRARLLYNFDSQWSVRGISEFNTFRESLSSSLLLSYVYKPGTVGYLGYQDHEPLGDAMDVRVERLVFLKVSILVGL